MTKSEKFEKAIKEALATIEQHRTLYWKLCHEYAAKSAEEGSNEELINQLSAFLFAAKATNLEAQAVCACYIAYTDFLKHKHERIVRACNLYVTQSAPLDIPYTMIRLQ